MMDCQSSVEGGIFIMVIGTLQQPQASAPKKFVQSFFLAPQQAPRVGYYVHNDVFRFLASSNTEATVGAPSSSDSTTVPHASTPSAPSTTTTTTPSAAAPATPEDNVHANNSQPTTAHHRMYRQSEERECVRSFFVCSVSVPALVLLRVCFFFSLNH